MLRKSKLVLLGTIIVAGCGMDANEARLAGGGNGGEQNSAGVIFSGVVTAAGGPNVSLVYLSLRPGTVSPGSFLTVNNVSTGASAIAPLPSGGVDPFPLGAAVDDSLLVTTTEPTGRVWEDGQRVKGRVPPRVVRSDPARGRTDIPLNVIIRVTFSAPMDLERARETITLQLDGAGGVDIAVDQDPNAPTVIELRPLAALAPGTPYVVKIDAGAQDVGGAQIDRPLLIPFRTSTVTSAPDTTETCFEANGCSGVRSHLPSVVEVGLVTGAGVINGTISQSEPHCLYWWDRLGFDVDEPCHAFRLVASVAGHFKAEVTWEPVLIANWMSFTGEDQAFLPTYATPPMWYARDVQAGEVIVLTVGRHSFDPGMDVHYALKYELQP